jgi:hypothetical protein
VGAIQYIPANEQLEVFPEGTSFNLDTVSSNMMMPLPLLFITSSHSRNLKSRHTHPAPVQSPAAGSLLGHHMTNLLSTLFWTSFLQDLDFIFTGFTGDCKWLSPGHLQYNVRNVKIEFRQPKVGTAAPPSLADAMHAWRMMNA